MTIPFSNPDSVEDSSEISCKNIHDISDKVSVYPLDSICSLQIAGDCASWQFEN